MSSVTSFYVQKPGDEYWNTGMTNCVIEASPIDVSESGLADWRKTDEYVRQNLKVITPKEFSWPFVKKSLWEECSGPSRKLEFREYVQLYHSLRPKHPLPSGWKEHKSTK